MDSDQICINTPIIVHITIQSQLLCFTKGIFKHVHENSTNMKKG